MNDEIDAAAETFIERLLKLESSFEEHGQGVRDLDKERQQLGLAVDLLRAQTGLAGEPPEYLERWARRVLEVLRETDVGPINPKEWSPEHITLRVLCVAEFLRAPELRTNRVPS